MLKNEHIGGFYYFPRSRPVKERSLSLHSMLIPYLCSAPASQSLSTVAWVSASGLSTVAVKVM